MENKAINLFKSAYGKTPEEAGFSVIDFDEEKNVFLYADSKKTINAYYTQQNIFRFMRLWYMWPLMFIFVNFFDALVIYQDVLHPRCIATYVFCCIWLILAVALYIKIWLIRKSLKKRITCVKYC